MMTYVLLFDAGKDSEGIHSLELKGKTVILMFENIDDAERYRGLLEAQDFPLPTVERIERIDLEQFCKDAGYEARFVPKGFIPKTDEDRLLISPPELNLDVSNWNEIQPDDKINLESKELFVREELDNLRKRLEDLI